MTHSQVPVAAAASERSGLNPNVDAETECEDVPVQSAEPAEPAEPAEFSGPAEPAHSEPAVDPAQDSPGAGVDDTTSPEAVEPNEPG